jgi:peroxiredoxin
MAASALRTLVDRPIPDLALPSSAGGELRLREFVGRRPLVLFFYVLNGSPG